MKKTLILAVSIALFTGCTSLLFPTYTSVGSVLPLTAPMGDNLTVTEDPATGLYGYLNDFGMWAIAPQFSYAQNFQDGLAIVKIGSRYGAIDVAARVVIKPVFESSLDVASARGSIVKGRMAGVELWCTMDAATELYGYLNHYGEWAIAPIYPSAKSFDRDGFAVVRSPEGGWGVINRAAAWVIAPNFESSLDAGSALGRLRR
jgi:hypothetical protein